MLAVSVADWAGSPAPLSSPAWVRPVTEGQGYYPPERYGSQWLWIGLGLLALVVLWYVFTIWYTRPRKVAPVALSGDRLAKLKVRYTEQIDQVVARVATGTQDARTGHQQISVLVRHFVKEAGGYPAPTMTLTDLNRSGIAQLRPVAGAVGTLYPGEFGPEDPRPGEDVLEVRRSANAAREVISTWT